MITGGFLYPIRIYLLKVNNENSNVSSEMPFTKISNCKSVEWFLNYTSFSERYSWIGIRTMYEFCSMLTIKILEPHHQHCSGVFIVNFEQIPHLEFLLLKQFWTGKYLLPRSLKITLRCVHNNFDIILFLQRTPRHVH